MRRVLRPAALVAAWVALASCNQQDVRTAGACSPVVDRTQGSVTLNLACTAEITPTQLQQITDAVRAGQAIPPELLERSERLAQRLGVADTAVTNFFRILGDRKVAIEDLDAKLREIAGQHLTLLKQLETLSGEDPQVASIKKEAVTAVGAGDYARAQSLLEKAYDADLVAARKAQDAANRRFVTAAKTKSDLGQLKLTQLQYAAAAQEFLAAADLVPAGEPLIRAEHLSAGGMAALDAGIYPRAEGALTEALRIREKLLPPNHSDVAKSLNTLALLYRDQGRYAEAEPLANRALAIREKTFGPEHPEVAGSLTSIGGIHFQQGRNAEAEPLFKRALAIREKTFGPEHSDFAISLYNLAVVYDTLGRRAEAEALSKRALAISEKTLGPEHPYVADNLNNLATIYDTQGRRAEAEPLYQRALAIRQKALGPEHPHVADTLNNLASLYVKSGRVAEAEPLLERAVASYEKVFGPDHPNVAISLGNLAQLYRALGRDAEALVKRVLAIQEKVFGPDHEYVATSLTRLALLHAAQGRYAEAEPLLQRALAIKQKAFGPEHPDVATSQKTLSEVLELQRLYTGLELMVQSVEQTHGVDHPDAKAARQMLLQSRGRPAEVSRGGQSGEK